jgi:hypothetical protein
MHDLIFALVCMLCAYMNPTTITSGLALACITKYCSALLWMHALQDPTSREPNPTADYNSTSRTAVLADADALSSCYGVGEVLLPDVLHTVVELGFTSSIRFLQPGLLLHGHSAPHSHGSYDDGTVQGSGFGAGLVAAVKGLFGGNSSSGSSSKARRRQQQGLHSVHSNSSSSSSSSVSSRAGDYSAGPSPSSSRSSSPTAVTSSRSGSPQYYQQQQQQQLPPPSSKQPRSSWRHRKEIEDAGRAEGLTEWQVRRT